ncbi:hypothetical protein KAS08_05435 [Candidatus Pacearchaeota archaeon]|nr:hypothetical protein [Candidatus Pacearchaeota archaeon]
MKRTILILIAIISINIVYAADISAFQGQYFIEEICAEVCEIEEVCEDVEVCEIEEVCEEECETNKKGEETCKDVCEDVKTCKDEEKCEDVEMCKEKCSIPEQLFDITFVIEDSIIEDSNELEGVITYESFRSVPTPVDLTFIIIDENGNEIYFEKSNVVVSTEEIMRWEYSGLDIPNGKYVAIFKTIYNVDVSDEFEQAFRLNKIFGGKF